MYYQNPACAAAGAVVDGDGRVLLIRRRIAPFRGDWALPAGYQEIDEDPRETALREVREETGICDRSRGSPRPRSRRGTLGARNRAVGARWRRRLD